jgi:hypothetical protein
MHPVIGYAPDGSIIGNSQVEMSNGQSRYKVAQEFASHNGVKPNIWADALLAAWHSLDEQRRDAAEKLTLESLADE